ncbi:MAG: hypothetical protein GY936_16290 [Ignavibacteriae bacterium]|nr:hypothetical protein [Ignavibacteriota bacterium]
MLNNNIIFRSVLVLLFAYSVQTPLRSQDYKVGDKSDGSRLKPVHLINLLDGNGNKIDPNDAFAMPFSTKQTCGSECHDYEKISDGFHFNYHDSNLVNDEPREPWIYTDPTTLSLIPLSYRKDAGTFTPEEVNLSPKQFLFRFGPYYPGGDISELDSLEHPDNFIRWMVTGKLETNCLICHDADPYYDQAEYAGNMRKQNFKWVAAASSSFTEFKGNASSMPDNYDPYNFTTIQSVDQRSPIVPKLTYKKSEFNSENKVYFNVSKDIPNDNCYYCHSSTVTDENFNTNWKSNEDVHIKAGLKCVDCHSNGIDHNMVKGIEKDNMQNSSPLSCEGCHIQNTFEGKPGNGNLGAPIPEHAGIPPIHFEKLSCTTCHSGNWPTEQANYVKTSRNHFLGMHGTNKAPDVFPHITTNIFTESNSNKIEPRNVIWPSFWGWMVGDTILPLPLDFVEKTIRPMLALDSLVNFGEWPSISDSLVISVLDSLTTLNATKGTPIFVTGGKTFELNNGNLRSSNNKSELGYSWRTAHTVRPASQALGINGCEDCHAVSSPFFTSDVNVESSLISQSGKKVSANEYQNNSQLYQTIFSSTFFFRPWLKFIIILSALIILIVLVGYIFYGIKSVSSIIFSDNQNTIGEK